MYTLEILLTQMEVITNAAGKILMNDEKWIIIKVFEKMERQNILAKMVQIYCHLKKHNS